MQSRRAILVALSLVALISGAEPPRRIVSLSPNLTEILYAVGAFGRVVGVSDYCTYPPEVTKLPSVGGWHNPSLEKLMAMRPDLVIVDDGQAPFIEEKFKELGLPLLVVRNHMVGDIYGAIATVGRATGHAAEAARLVETTRRGLDRVSAKTARLSKPRVVLIVDRTPGTLRDLYTATEGSFYAELIAMAGGRMAGPPAARGYGKLNKEDLLAINPDVILDFIHGVKSRFAGDPMEAWQEMPELKAVRERRVYGVNEDYVPHASQRVLETAELFARLLHPEAR